MVLVCTDNERNFCAFKSGTYVIFSYSRNDRDDKRNCIVCRSSDNPVQEEKSWLLYDRCHGSYRADF